MKYCRLIAITTLYDGAAKGALRIVIDWGDRLEEQPRTTIVDCINRLAAQGWRVVGVSSHVAHLDDGLIEHEIYVLELP